MRKKQFESIPPEYEHQEAENGQNYAISALVRDDVLAVDFYSKECGVWRAIWRTLITAAEYANFVFYSRVWDAKSIRSESSRKYGCYTNLQCGKYFELGGAGQIISAFAMENGKTIYHRPLITLEMWENDIRDEKRIREEERKMARTRAKMAEIPPIPKQLKAFVDRLYRKNHVMYVSEGKAVCSRCGKVTEAGKDKRHNTEGICPGCGSEIAYCHTKRRIVSDTGKEILLVQANGGEIIHRYFRCNLHSEAGKPEKLDCKEVIRVYFDRESGRYKNRYVSICDVTGDSYWYKGFKYGTTLIYGKKSYLYTGNLAELKELYFILDSITEAMAEVQPLPWKYILTEMQETRMEMLEKLFKAGLTRLAAEYADGRVNRIKYGESRLRKALGITKPMFGYMQKSNGGVTQLEILREGKSDNCGLNDGEIIEIAEAGIKISELKEICEGNKIIKMLHYLQAVSGYKKLREAYTHYKDYIEMMKALDYDLCNGTIRYPKNLRVAHDKAVSEICREEQDKRKREVLIKYPRIKKRSSELNGRYGYCDGTYEISAPVDAAEIVEEGRLLHHCVGGNNYLQKHDEGKTVILFLRKVKEPDKPYYTVELCPEDNRILQYYGYNDLKPDKQIVDAVLKRWKQQLERRNA